MVGKDNNLTPPGAIVLGDEEEPRVFRTWIRSIEPCTANAPSWSQLVSIHVS